MSKTEKIKSSEIIIFKTEDEKISVDVRFEDETVWLTQQQMSDLFQTSRTNVVEHIKHIYEEGELSEKSTCRNFRQVQMEGNRNVTRDLPFYNLDMIISVGKQIQKISGKNVKRSRKILFGNHQKCSKSS